MSRWGVLHESTYISLFLTWLNKFINKNKTDDLHTSTLCLTRLFHILLMTSQSIPDNVTMAWHLWCNHVNCDNSLDIDVIHSDIHSQLYKKSFYFPPQKLYITGFIVTINPMMMSSNGNIFRDTGPLCGEFTSHRWIPCTKASDVELWCFLWSASE